MVRRHLNACRASGLQVLLRGDQLLRRRLQLALRGGLGLLVGGLVGLLVLHVLRVRLHLVIQRLLEHVIVVLRVHLGLAQVAELALGLLLHVLQDVHDAAALRLVHRRSGRPRLQVVIRLSLLCLHERDQLLLVAAGEGGGVEHGAQGLQRTRHVLRVHLRQGSRALRHLPLQNCDSPAQGVNRIHKLALARRKLGHLLLPDQRRVLQLLIRLRDARRQPLDGAAAGVDVARQLTDVRLQLVLLLRRGLHCELQLLRRVVAPLEVLVVGLGRRLSVRRHLGRQLVHQPQHGAQRVRHRFRA
mmetsp:Transcript_48960/g.136205  ORF Transcript_48960/g.136205 Transcript_48960/m.136205 type:complete len:301 (-) Transcript_48960:116-1018(-)